ncbi:ASB_HP2_G0031570.mRNA.1.CDS.1 [Saccharomyces cerevisiae]|nr:ASB_HP2_G0031570.mRNA.1.CDS.1 [Saccharomyces cerevisiae]CAI6610588.1 ASB_HP2_G0031570.mRNA.1.CDS.1 [Saccharomyces cerevisiae]
MALSHITKKLNLLGSQFLKYQASIHSLRQNNVLSPVARGKVQRPLNNLNFTNLGTQLSKFLISKDAIAEFIKEKHLGGRPPHMPLVSVIVGGNAPVYISRG